MNVINLKVDGQKIVAKMGILAFRLYCDYYKIELDEIDAHIEKRGLFGLTDLVFFAHCAARNIEGEAPLVNLHQCTELVESENEEFFKLITEAVMDSKMMGKTLRERKKEQEGAKKKNRTPSPSKSSTKQD